MTDDIQEDLQEQEHEEEQPDRRRPAVGVSFRRGGKVYYFDPNGVDVKPGDHVLVRTDKGVDIAQVVRLVFNPAELNGGDALKPIVRKASQDDLEYEEQLRRRERAAMRTCEQKIAAYGLPMKLIDADYTFDCRCLVFFFSSEGRVDFRELVRDLARAFKTRIELRQIGVRDEAKMIGGLGSCGRPLCCQTFLRNFDPVGIKVAKDQGLSLNPSKISGICDRLMCCLRYEHELYQQLRGEMPSEGETVVTPQGPGDVVGRHLLAGEVVVQLEDQTQITVPVSKLKRRASSERKEKR